MILGLGPIALNAMNNLGLWILYATQGSSCNEQLKVVVYMNNLGLWMKSMTSGSELRSLDAMNDFVPSWCMSC